MSRQMEAMMREQIAVAEKWDMKEPLNRRTMRLFKRRLWWARNGTWATAVISAIVSSAIGVTIGKLTYPWLRSMGWFG